MKNIVVIGGTKGIGAALVEILKNDAQVFVFARNENEQMQNPNVRFFNLDITKESIDLEILPETLDGLVYCPGSINLKPFNRLTIDDFNSDWEINVLGAVKSIQQLLPKLKKSESGSIVLFSTVAVKMGMPFHTSVAASKAAIEGLTVSLAAELAPKIRVNCIAPSLTNTPLAEKLLNTPEKTEASGKRHPLQRVGNAEEIAKMANYLLKEESSWMTGQVLRLDGGMSSIK